MVCVRACTCARTYLRGRALADFWSTESVRTWARVCAHVRRCVCAYVFLPVHERVYRHLHITFKLCGFKFIAICETSS